MAQYPFSIPRNPARDLAMLEDEITELAAHINAATYRLLTLIHESDERHGWSGAGLKSCAHWLNWKCGINPGAAREKVRGAGTRQSAPCTAGTQLARRRASHPPLGGRRGDPPRQSVTPVSPPSPSGA